MSKQKDMFNLITEISGQNNILTIPRIFIDFMDSLGGGLLLSQLLYWCDKGSRPDGFFHKTHDEWAAEICLSKYELRKVSKQLVDRGLLETMVRKVNGNPTVHYRLNTDKLVEELNQFNSSKVNNTKKAGRFMIPETLENRFTDAGNRTFLNQPDEKIIPALANYLESDEKREKLETDIEIFFQFARQGEVEEPLARKLVNISFILDKFDVEQYRKGRELAEASGKDRKLSYLRKVLEKAFMPKPYTRQRSLKNKNTTRAIRKPDEGPYEVSGSV